jgi:hypothetical protein
VTESRKNFVLGAQFIETSFDDTTPVSLFLSESYDQAAPHPAPTPQPEPLFAATSSGRFDIPKS